jgi:nucleoside-diphosphate-sugar epimerase
LARETSNRERLPQDVEIITGDLQNQETLNRAVDGVEIVFHLAAATRARSEREYVQANAEGTQRLVEAALAAHPQPQRFIYLSSLAAAGPAQDGKPVQLQDRPRPITAYGRSKLAGEHFCRQAASDMKMLMLRAPAVYGPRDRDLFICFLLAAYGILLAPRGSERLLQFIHVNDLVEALLLAATTSSGTGVYHVAESRPYAWGEIATWLAQAVGRRVRAVRIPSWLVQTSATISEYGAAAIGRATIFNRDKAQEMLAPGWLCETEAAKRDLGFTGKIPLPRGLMETATWYRAHGWL